MGFTSKLKKSVKDIGGKIDTGFEGIGKTITGDIVDPVMGALGLEDPDVSGYKRKLRRGRKGLEEAAAPYAAAGIPALSALQAGATPEGYTANIQDLLESTAPLRAQRRDTAEDYLRRQGISRSTAGAEMVADVDYETLVNLENLLSQRQAGLTQLGYGAATGTAANIADLYSAAGAADLAARQQRGQITAGLIGGALTGLGGLGAAAITAGAMRNRTPSTPEIAPLD